MTAAELEQAVQTVADESARKDTRIAYLEQTIKAVIQRLTHGTASELLDRSCLTVDDEARDDLRWCLGRLRQGLK